MFLRRGAKLTNTDLESVDFENADLSDAVLEGAQARHTLKGHQEGMGLGEEGVRMFCTCGVIINVYNVNRGYVVILEAALSRIWEGLVKQCACPELLSAASLGCACCTAKGVCACGR